MKRVVLLVTGDAEAHSLHRSLQKLFPEATFEKPHKRDSFTSCTLPPEPVWNRNLKAPTSAEKLAQALIAEVEPGRRDKSPADLVLLVDDLELCNKDHPERAIHHLRKAVERHLERHPWPSSKSQNQARERLAQRCSFHLFAPMLEAYFFADPNALSQAGATRPSKMDALERDVEDFLVDDPDFQDRPNRPPGEELPPWATPERTRHPKQYLQFLCDPSGSLPRAYKETQGGQSALHHLNWNAVFQPQAFVRFARSLIYDVADSLGNSIIPAQFQGQTHPLTWPPSPQSLLRNI